MQTLLLVIHALVALSIIGLVLLQHGKGADMGAAFGSGASGSLFGSSGSANFLSRATAILAAIFFATSLGLTWFSSHKPTVAGAGIMTNAPVLPQSLPEVPAVPAAAQPVVPAGPAPEGDKAKEIPN